MKKPRRKTVLIILIVVAIITSAIAFGVVSFMNSPKMKLPSIMQKIPKIEKGEGVYSIEAKLHLSEGDVEVGIKDGTLALARQLDEKQPDTSNFLQAKGTIYAKADEDSKLRLGAKYINDEKGEWTLTDQYVFKSSVFNQETTYPLDNSLKHILSKIFVGSSKIGTNNEESLQSFVLKGYEPQITEEQNKAGITMTKAEILKLVRKAEENIRTDRQKFSTLVQKQYPELTVTQIEVLTNQLSDGELSKYIEKEVFSKMTDFYFKIMFEEKTNDTINITTEFKCVGTTMLFEKETTINLLMKTSMNYKVLA